MSKLTAKPKCSGVKERSRGLTANQKDLLKRSEVMEKRSRGVLRATYHQNSQDEIVWNIYEHSELTTRELAEHEFAIFLRGWELGWELGWARGAGTFVKYQCECGHISKGKVAHNCSAGLWSVPKKWSVVEEWNK